MESLQGFQTLRDFFARQQSELGIECLKVKTIHGSMLCGVALKNNKEVLVVCTTEVGGVLSSQMLTLSGSGNVGSWGLVTMAGDSASSFQVFVIEGCASGVWHKVSMYDSRRQAWLKLCQLPESMWSYLPLLPRLPSVVLGEFLYILLLPLDGVERTCFTIAALDYNGNEWSEFHVITPRAFSRLRLVKVEEHLLLVGIREGRFVDRYFIIHATMSTAKTKCVEICEMPEEFATALVDSNAKVKSSAVVCGHGDSVFFMTSTKKPVAYSTSRNAWNFVFQTIV
ncbi:hypothetical protein M758_2G172900 [Ceratodon purpureus]|nr:hypothetical protein M758_2G172900 [Ceratodon purpureus]